MSKSLVFVLCLLSCLVSTHALLSPKLVSPPTTNRVLVSVQGNPNAVRLAMASEDESEDGEDEASATESTKLSLEEKMKAWEATEEEVRASTLGGIVPGSSSSAERSDAFDVGLYIAFPIIVLSSLAFAFFPFLVGNLDVDSVGPPPTL